MEKESRIFVAGHRGLAGSALIRCLEAEGYSNIFTRSRDELDLSDQNGVRDFFREESPEYVFLAAALVGGIQANNTRPAEFVHENLIIQDNVIHQSWLSGVRRLLFLGSSCVFPRNSPQPMKEEYLLTGELEPTNRPYAVAKIAGIETCWAYNRQYGTGYIAVMPTNMYGPGDNYDLDNSHVLPALIRKVHDAKTSGASVMTAWGSGSPRREFLYSDDMARACVLLMKLSDESLKSFMTDAEPPLFNIGWGKDTTIRELVDVVKRVVGFEGEIVWDTDKPDGTPRKLLDVERLFGLGWRPEVGLVNGIRRAYNSFLQSEYC